jgi:hypothetical protein
VRGEFVAVWSDMWAGIWAPLAEDEDAPDDLFCQLYGEILSALKDPSAEASASLVISDPIQLRQAFERALVLRGVSVDLTRWDEVLDSSQALSLGSVAERRAGLEAALRVLIDDPVEAAESLAEAVRELASDPDSRTEALARSRERILNDPIASRDAFEHIQSDELAGERALAAFLEAAQGVLDDSRGDQLANRYFNLLAAFIDRYSLRYDLRRPCTLCPTLTGLFAGLVRELNGLGLTDENTSRRLRDFREAIQDLRLGQSEGRIANCVAKQVMLLEAIGATSAGITRTELAGICGQLNLWPHPAMKASLLSLYGLASDFPGLRHGTPSTGMLRDIDMRDMVAISILLAGFTPYLSDQLNADIVYRGS